MKNEFVSLNSLIIRHQTLLSLRCSLLSVSYILIKLSAYVLLSYVYGVTVCVCSLNVLVSVAWIQCLTLYPVHEYNCLLYLLFMYFPDLERRQDMGDVCENPSGNIFAVKLCSCSFPH